MSAMEMMLKSFGLDPEAIKKKVEEAGEDFKKVVEGLHKRFDDLEKKIDAVLEIHQVKIETKTEGETK